MFNVKPESVEKKALVEVMDVPVALAKVRRDEAKILVEVSEVDMRLEMVEVVMVVLLKVKLPLLSDWGI